MSIAALIAILGLQSLARFFGIIIRMFAELAAPHHQDAVGIYAIDPIELLAGDLRQRQRRFAEAWAEIRQAELLAAWGQLQAGRLPGKIEPLR